MHGGETLAWVGWGTEDFLDGVVLGLQSVGREKGIWGHGSGVPLLLPLCLQPLFAGMSKIISVVI